MRRHVGNYQGQFIVRIADQSEEFSCRPCTESDHASEPVIDDGDPTQRKVIAYWAGIGCRSNAFGTTGQDIFIVEVGWKRDVKVCLCYARFAVRKR